MALKCVRAWCWGQAVPLSLISLMPRGPGPERRSACSGSHSKGEEEQVWTRTKILVPLEATAHWGSRDRGRHGSQLLRRAQTAQGWSSRGCRSWVPLRASPPRPSARCPSRSPLLARALQMLAERDPEQQNLQTGESRSEAVPKGSPCPLRPSPHLPPAGGPCPAPYTRGLDRFTSEFFLD